MQMLVPPFEEPGSFLRFFDPVGKEFKFVQLTEMEAPLKYPFRLDETSHGALSNEHTFDDIEPSRTDEHLSQAFLGVKPDARFEVFQPVDEQALVWDKNIEDIQLKLTRSIEYSDSPFHAPRFNLWIQEDKPPSVRARVFPGPGETMTPELIWIAAKYNFIDQTRLSDDVLEGLRSREIPSAPIKFEGGLP